jgi:outer membrane protein assembly factor BamB
MTFLRTCSNIFYSKLDKGRRDMIPRTQRLFRRLEMLTARGRLSFRYKSCCQSRQCILLLIPIAVIVSYAIAYPVPAIAGDWKSWRGDQGNGTTVESSLPSSWVVVGDSSNVKWKAELPGPGNSSPIVSNGRVWITQYDQESDERQLRCYDATSGDLVWMKSVKPDEAEPTHPTNPYCASSPITDGKLIAVFFGSAGLCCYTQEGTLVWQRKLGSPQHLFGQGASPLIHGDLVTLNYGPGAEQFWITLDLATGDEIWRLPIDKVDAPNPFDDPNGPKLPPGSKLRDPFGSWATPVLASSDGREILLLADPSGLRAADPRTGAVIWQCQKLGPQVFWTPLVIDDLVVCMGATGMAVRMSGKGDVTETHREWFDEEDRPRIGTGVEADGDIIANTMQGIVESINVKTGKRNWQKRLAGASGGGSWSSLVRTGDRVFATNQDGSIYVFKTAPDFELLATNKLDESTNASPAIVGDRIYVRTDKHLWCIGPL